MSPAERQRLRDHGASMVADWAPLAPDEVEVLAVLLRPGSSGRSERRRRVVDDVDQAAGGDAA
jgi:hypothetical protein